MRHFAEVVHHAVLIIKSLFGLLVCLYLCARLEKFSSDIQRSNFTDATCKIPFCITHKKTYHRENQITTWLELVFSYLRKTNEKLILIPSSLSQAHCKESVCV